MPSPYNHSKTLTTTTTRFLKTPLVLLSSFLLLYLLYHTHIYSLSTPTITHTSLSTPTTTTTTTTTTTSLHHLVFGIASSSKSYPKRLSYIHIWFKPYMTRGYVFLDHIPTYNDTLIPILISKDTSKFPYTFPRGLRSAIRVDMRGSLFGMLSAHPLAPLVSLHHLDNVEPIFPGMNHSQALEQLLLAVKVDSERILQQTVCYDHSKSLTISISWGYSVQVYEGNQLLPDLLPLQRSFVPWRRSVNAYSNPFMFNIREYSKYPCKRPAVFYLENVFSKANEIQSNYKRQFVKNCVQNGSVKNLEEIVVFSQKLDLDIGKLQAPRRHCCDVLTPFDTKIDVRIRQCGDEELIAMDP